MIPTQEMVPYPVFGDNSIKVQPDYPKYAAGFDPGDVLPAEWLNWFLSRASGAVTKLNAGAHAMEQEINNVLTAGSITPDAAETDQLITAIAYLINQAVLTEQQKPAVGVPTLWLGPKPDWALDFGNGANTKYLWANYPKLNNDKFKSILTQLSDRSWMTAHDNSGFYVPDLRGIVPIGYGINAVRTAETTQGGANPGVYWASTNKAHVHNFQLSKTDGYWRMRNYDSYEGIGIFKRDGQSVQSQAFTLGSEGATSRYDFYLSIDKATTSQGSDIAKPPTIACMWIVRFE